MPEQKQFASFGARLEHWRTVRGYKRQGAFAEAIGIKQGSLSELESGKSKQPAADVLLKICEVLKLRPKYLLHGEGPAEGQYFQELSGPEAQLVMIFRALPTDGMRDALLIEANEMLRRSTQATRPTELAMPPSTQPKATRKPSGDGVVELPMTKASKPAKKTRKR